MSPQATAAGVALLVAHALFKSGAVPDDRRRRARHRQPRPAAPVRASAGRCRCSPTAAALCTVSMIGLPPLLGFVAKESALAALVDGRRRWVDRRAGRGGRRLGADDGVLGPAVVGPVRDQAAARGRGRRPCTTAAAGRWSDRSCVLGGGVAGRRRRRRRRSAARLAVAAESLDDARRTCTSTLWPGLHLPLLLSCLIVRRRRCASRSRVIRRPLRRRRRDDARRARLRPHLRRPARRGRAG